jgi:hypothetical protein
VLRPLDSRSVLPTAGNDTRCHSRKKKPRLFLKAGFVVLLNRDKTYAKLLSAVKRCFAATWRRLNFAQIGKAIVVVGRLNALFLILAHAPRHFALEPFP